MDLPLPDETPLQPGATVTIHTGVRGRHLSCTSRYLGRQTRAVGAAAVADCLVFTAPAEFRGDQRRKAFRIPIQSRIVAEVQPLPQPDGAEPQDERPGVLVQLLDLSFTGARLGAPEGQLREAFQVGEAVHCRLVFPGLERVAEVRALVRRCDTVPADRNERQDVLGVEFQINGTSCRRTLEFVRDFVLAEQRALLARRVEILGSA